MPVQGQYWPGKDVQPSSIGPDRSNRSAPNQQTEGAEQGSPPGAHLRILMWACAGKTSLLSSQRQDVARQQEVWRRHSTWCAVGCSGHCLRSPENTIIATESDERMTGTRCHSRDSEGALCTGMLGDSRFQKCGFCRNRRTKMQLQSSERRATACHQQKELEQLQVTGGGSKYSTLPRVETGWRCEKVMKVVCSFRAAPRSLKHFPFHLSQSHV